MRFIFCSFAPVGLEDYVDYFKDNFDEFAYLRWRFPHMGNKTIFSALYIYKRKRLIEERKLFSFSFVRPKTLYFLFLPLNYLIYFSQALLLFNSKPKNRRTVFMGINYFCTFCGIILKKLGKVDFVIYRVMDFFPLPPRGFYRYLNRIFYIFDKFCLKRSDSIWFTTEGHMMGREKYGYFDRKKYNYQIIPLGVNINRFVYKPTTEKNKYSLVYCGVITRYHLLDLLLEVILELKKDFKNIRLNLIGGGPDEEYFKDMVRKMGLVENVIFYGFMKEGEKFTNLMTDNILGIALYKNEENFMKYTEPAKVKYYLSYGVPAVVSDVPVIARELHEKKVCFATKNDKAEIVRIVKNLILDAKMQSKYKENIKEFVKTIDITKLLNETFHNTFNFA
jgi:glycosyltransferase involved in cell wall biosynthesis